MIQPNNLQTDNIFNEFPKYNLGNCSVKKTAAASNITEKEPMVYDIVSIKERENKKSGKGKTILFGSTIASSIIAAGLTGLLLAKGFHGSSFDKFSKFYDKLTSNMPALDSGKGLKNKAAYFGRKKLSQLMGLLDAVSNFTALKDWGSNKLFEKTKPTKKFAQKSSGFFKNIVDSTLNKKYNKAGEQVHNMSSLLKYFNSKNLSNGEAAKSLSEKITIKGETLTVSEWFEKLSEHSETLQQSFDNNFSLGALRKRDSKRSAYLKDLPEKIAGRFFPNKKIEFNIDAYKSYATADLTKNSQKALEEEIMTAKSAVTNNIDAVHSNLKNKLHNISSKIKPADENTLNSVKSLKEQLELFKNCSGSAEKAKRTDISANIESIVQDSIKTIKESSLYNADEKNFIIKNLTKMKESATDVNKAGSKGALEEIMTILKGLNTSSKNIVSDSSYKEFENLSNKIRKELNSAAELEAGEYFLKQAELKVGSAPTDVLSILFPIGAGAYAIGKGDNKDERISATLNTCIPLVGTFATFVYGTTKMLSGPKNLIFSFVSGIALSKLGAYCDKLYKKYKDTGSVSEVVQGEYNQVRSNINPQYSSALAPKTK